MDKKIANLYDTGNVDKAIHLLIEKINKHPQDIENYLQLSTYLIEQNAADQALELLEKARGLVKHPEDLTYNIAVCYYMQGDFAKSLTLLNSIADDEETMYQKALIFMKLGQYQKALAYALTLTNPDEAEKYFKLSKNQDPKYFAQAQKQYNAVAKLIRGKNGRN